jgi:hypothetical protein
MINRKSSDIKDEFLKLGTGGRQGIKATPTWPLQQHPPHFSVLDQEIKWLKLNERIIIKGKFMNGDEIFVGRRNMQHIGKDKIMTWSGNNRSANVRDLHTCPICRIDLIGAMVGIVHGELV